MTLFGQMAPVTAIIGLLIILLNLLIAVAGPWFAPYGETQVVGGGWDPSSAAAWFGTDQIGRDMLTRLIYGARMTIGIAFVTTLLSFAIGITLGLVAATLGRWVDIVITRLVDVVLSIPLLIWALMILNIAFLDSTRVFRLARALGMNIVALDFVEVARLRGEGLWWIISREVLPNCAAPLMSEFGLRFCFNFLFIAALSFLGLGVPLPYADWGGMVKDNVGGISFGLPAALYPAAAIALLTVGINLVVDWFLSIDARPSGAQAEM